MENIKILLVTISILFTGYLCTAQTPPVETFTSFHNKPIDLEFHPDGDKMIVAERAGILWLYNLVGEEWIREETPFLDFSEQVTTYFERGLQSIVVDDFYVYTYYTVEESYLYPELNLPVDENSATVNRVSRWEVSWNQNVAVFGEDILVDSIPSLAGNHQGGGLALTNDQTGRLFISVGDGASAGYAEQAVERGIIPEELIEFDGRYRSQIKSTPNGKILCVNSFNGLAHFENPYYNVTDRESWLSRLYDYGYRNPFEISYYNGKLTVADVGAGSKEEITVAKNDGNAGWGKYEGFNDYSFSDTKINPDTGSPFEVEYNNKPLLDYGHNGEALTRLLGEDNEPTTDGNAIEGNSITGGTTITTAIFGNDLQESYIFTDFTRGWINAAVTLPDSSGELYSYTVELYPSNTLSGPVDITQAPNGDIFIVNLFGVGIQIIKFQETLSIPTVELSKKFKYYNNTNYITTVNPVTIYNTLGQKVAYIQESGYLELKRGVYIGKDSEGNTLKFIITK